MREQQTCWHCFHWPILCAPSQSWVAACVREKCILLLVVVVVVIAFVAVVVVMVVVVEGGSESEVGRNRLIYCLHYTRP